MTTKEDNRKTVRDAYGKIARNNSSCCGTSGCETDKQDYLEKLGYSSAEIETVPEGADLSLGCGNPVASAGIIKGDTVLDLGAGAGIDCFLAAGKTGPSGRVIGVDMTPEMLRKGRKNARESGMNNVEFRLGEIENLPLADSSVDIILSNCVINLSPDKDRVFEEIYRVLKPGGRICISDMALTEKLPPQIEENIQAYIGCIAGALKINDYENLVHCKGFRDVQISRRESSACLDLSTEDPVIKKILESMNSEDNENDIRTRIGEIVKSITIQAKKPEEPAEKVKE